MPEKEFVSEPIAYFLNKNGEEPHQEEKVC